MNVNSNVVRKPCAPRIGPRAPGHDVGRNTFLSHLDSSVPGRSSVDLDDLQEDREPVVTLNCTLRLRDRETGSFRDCTLVDPQLVYLFPDGLTVCSPLGSALMGCAEGDLVSYWELGRVRVLSIESIVPGPQ